jgi:hypothetical protein
MTPQITGRPLPMVTLAPTTKKNKSSDQTALSILATSLITSSWTRRITMSRLPSNLKEVRNAQRAAGMKSQLLVNSAHATSSTLKVRIQGHLECLDLPT